MPNSFSKYAAFSTVLVVIMALFGGEWREYTFQYFGAFYGILIYYNIYLYFKEAYKSSERRVVKQISRPLAGLSGLYAFAGTVNVFGISGTGSHSRSEVFFIGGIFMFIFGYIAFWFFVSYLRYVFEHPKFKQYTKW